MTPITLVTSFYAAGIAAGEFIPIPIDCLIVSMILAMAGALLLTASGKKPMILICLIIFLGGTIAFHWSDQRTFKFHKKTDKTPIVVSVANAIKDKLIAGEQRTMNEPYSSLLGSIIFGSAASPIPDELQDKYRIAGVIHLLVVSGTQVSIIISVFLNICGSIGFSRPITFILSSIANLVFAIMVGAGPSIVRAAVMAEAALFARTFGMDNDFYNSLSLSALALLLFDPATLFNIGFQLSFIATWALFYVAPAIELKLSDRLPEYLSKAIAVSVAPTIATTALTFYNFAQISFVSVLTNFLIVPWVEITVVLGFASTMIGLFLEPLAYVINNTLTLMLIALNSIIYFFADLPFACVYFTPPHFVFILLYYAALIKGVEMLKRGQKIRFNKVLVAIVLGLIIFPSFFTRSFADGPHLTVSIIDVGQGDSILIESPSGRTALIDGGDSRYKAGRYKVLPYLHKRGVNKLDLVVLTHPHDDHVGGLNDVLENMKVDMVMDGGQSHTSPLYLKFLKTIEKKNILYKLARAGQELDLGGGVMGYVLAPSEPFITGTSSDLNNNSVVIKLVYGKTSFLLVGDLQAEGESKIIPLGEELKSDVLKVGHHGSKYSTSDRFLELVQPGYAVISVGAKNLFGHPNAGTIEKLESSGAKVFRTDRSGTVIIESDGKTIKITHS